MEELALAVAALFAGCVLGALVVYWFDRGRFEAQLPERLRESNEQAAGEALKRSRATLKGQIGERFAPFEGGFGYEPADARFLGSPVDYVVFDGLTDGQIRGVAFVEVKVGALPLTPFQKQVREAVNEGRIAWRVLQLPEQSSEA